MRRSSQLTFLGYGCDRLQCSSGDPSVFLASAPLLIFFAISIAIRPRAGNKWRNAEVKASTSPTTNVAIVTSILGEVDTWTTTLAAARL